MAQPQEPLWYYDDDLSEATIMMMMMISTLRKGLMFLSSSGLVGQASRSWY